MEEFANEAKSKMLKSIDSLKNDLATLRTGRASPALLNAIEIDYYGSNTPINQVSTISVPEPRQLLIKPYDKNDVNAIIKAINSSDIGINPVNEGNQIRLIIPALTEDRRKEIVKTARKYGEDAKIAIRNIRRDFMDLIKEDKESSEDYIKKVQDEIQKVTDESIKDVDNLISEKEKELMSL